MDVASLVVVPTGQGGKEGGSGGRGWGTQTLKGSCSKCQQQGVRIGEQRPPKTTNGCRLSTPCGLHAPGLQCVSKVKWVD